MSTSGDGEQSATWDRIRALLDEHDADALHLRLASSFAWASGGWSSVINSATNCGEGSLLIERDRRTLLTSAIEAPRYRSETDLAARGWEILEHPWTEGLHLPDGAPARERTIGDAPGDPLAARTVDLAHARAGLGSVEQQRMRELGADCAAAMWETCRTIVRGTREFEIAGVLARACHERGIEPIVTLIASDDRVRTLRHPRPADAAVEQLAMVVLCGRRHGLVVSLTRLVHVGPLSDDLRRRHAAVCEVDARMLAASVPGATLGDVFATVQQAYADTGFPDEWTLHHQGGLAGYEPREAVATPGSTLQLTEGNACAFNPSIAGTKSEDTILVRPAGAHPEVLTAMADWPMLHTSIDGLERPDILVV